MSLGLESEIEGADEEADGRKVEREVKSKRSLAG